MTLDEVLNIKEIKWLLDRSQESKPLEDEEYYEHSFKGKLPYRMVQAIKDKLRAFRKLDQTYTIYESNEQTERVLTIRFMKSGTMFFYTIEKALRGQI